VRASPSDPRVDVVGWRFWVGLVDDRAFRGVEVRGDGPSQRGELLDGHVALEIDCLDRIYCNAYVPNLQVSGRVATFLTQHLHAPIASPALLGRIGERFRNNVKRFAATHDIPLLRFAQD
jgi:hypothetical protein